MALSAALARRKTPAERLEVTATCAFEKIGKAGDDNTPARPGTGPGS
ncbi:MAG: hypothetical protein ACRDHS_02270 [Actinomycetota bacterium]